MSDLPYASSNSSASPVTLHSRRVRLWRLIGLIIALIAVVVCVAPDARAASGVTEHRLDNGLRIIIKQDKRAPTVVQMLWYLAGSMDESSGRTGIAHVLEHLMFKGTTDFPSGVFSQKVAAAGGRENAFTSRDYTGYYQQVQKPLLRDIMTMEADRMLNLQLTESDFSTEIDVVMEERRSRVDDQAGGRVSEQLLATAFVASPYRRPIIGWMHDLQNLTVDDARNWYKAWYAPNNAILTIAGDVEPDEVLAIARETYGKIKRRELPVRRLTAEPEQNGVRRAWVKAPADSPSIVMAFKAPKLNDIVKDTDPYALAMLSAVLSSGDTGRLARRLVRETRLANSAYASYSMLSRGPVLFSLGGRPAKGQTVDALEKALLEQVREIAKDGVEQAELDRIKAGFVAGRVYQRDSLFSQVMEIGSMMIAGFNHDDTDKLLEQARLVTPTDIKRVAAKYFNEDQMTVVTLDPQPIDPKQRRKRVRKGRH